MSVCMMQNCRKNAPSDEAFCAEHRDPDPHDKCKRELAAMTAERDALPLIMNAAIHQVCRYLHDSGKCMECPSQIECGPYGKGVQACYAIAEETIQKVLSALAAAIAAQDKP